MATIKLLNMPTGSLPHSGEIRSRPKQRDWRKPKDKPSRNLSAYNYFFAETRKQLIDDRVTAQMRGIQQANDGGNDALGFGGLARTVAARWRVVGADVKAKFAAMAETDRERYKKQLAQWNCNNSAHAIKSRPSHEAKPGSISMSTKVIPAAERMYSEYSPAPDVKRATAVINLAYVMKLDTTNANDDSPKMSTNAEGSEGRHHLLARYVCLDHASGCDSVDGKKRAGDCKHKFLSLQGNVSDSQCAKKTRFSDQPMEYDADLRSDAHYSSSFISDAKVQVYLEQKTVPSRPDEDVCAGGEDLSAAELEPLSLHTEIAQLECSGCNGEEVDGVIRTSPHTGSQSPSTVDRLLSVLNKEDCELLVRHFSA